MSLAVAEPCQQTRELPSAGLFCELRPAHWINRGDTALGRRYGVAATAALAAADYALYGSAPRQQQSVTRPAPTAQAGRKLEMGHAPCSELLGAHSPLRWPARGASVRQAASVVTRSRVFRRRRAATGRRAALSP